MRPDSESSVRLAILSLFRLENPVLKGPELCFNPATYKPIPVVLGLWSSSMKLALQLGISFLNVESFPHSSSISRDFLVFIWRIFSVSAASFGQPPKEQTFLLRGCARPSDNLNKHVDLQLKMIFHFKFLFDDARLLSCCPDSILTVRFVKLKRKEVHFTWSHCPVS